MESNLPLRELYDILRVINFVQRSWYNDLSSRRWEHTCTVEAFFSHSVEYLTHGRSPFIARNNMISENARELRKMYDSYQGVVVYVFMRNVKY